MTSQKISTEGIEYIPIKVTSGVILKIGAGIYSSAAGALKELVSNSYDADATHVLISTDYPNFNEIKIVDDGSGMTVERFRIAMLNIGSSLKGSLQENQETEKFKRPIIGRLGIGLMALSQVCDEAIIESQLAGSNQKFIAKIDFSDFKRREQKQQRIANLDVLLNKYGSVKELDNKILHEKDNDKLVELKTAKKLMAEIEKSLSKESKKDKNAVGDEHLGYCTIYPSLPAVDGEHGTTITLNNIDFGVKKLLKDVDRSMDVLPERHRKKGYGWDTFREEVNKLEWNDLCEKLRNSNYSYQELPQYHHFLWELSTMTNIPYLINGPISIDKKILSRKKKEIEDFNFTLIVDNKILYKPILLPPGNLGDFKDIKESLDYYIETVNFDKVVDKERLSFSGYIYWQRKQVVPAAIRGIQIYIRNIGIGPYDSSLMNFSKVNPTSRAGQISGEIYVEYGLDRALNVDRNSFRETDAHYLALQQYIWKLLGSTSQTDGILGRSVQAYFLRKEIVDQLREEERRLSLTELINKDDDDIKITFKNKESDRPYQIKNNEIILFSNSPAWPKSRDEKHFAQKMITLIKAALLSGASADEILELIEDSLLRK